MNEGELFRTEEARCTRCGLCADACPQGVVVAKAGALPKADPARVGSCLRCGHCVAVCPAGALQHEHLDPWGFPDAPLPPAPTDVLALLRSRRSVRRYRAQEVPRERVEELLEAAQYSPTGHNARQVGCVVLLERGSIDGLRDGVAHFYRRVIARLRSPLTRPLARLIAGSSRVDELLEALPGMTRAEERLRRGEDPLFHGASAVILFHAPAGRETSEADCAIAADHASLLAPALGLGTCHIGYAAAALKRLPHLAATLGVPAGHRTFSVLGLGYPALVYRRLVPRPPLPRSYR